MTGEADFLPLYHDCATKVERGLELSVLEQFVYANEPCSPSDDTWRSDLCLAMIFAKKEGIIP